MQKSRVSQALRSNAIIIYADDFGFDVGAFGAPTVKTPNLDKLAREGAKLTQYYSAENVCTPSRGAVLTGRHAARSGLIIDVGWGQCDQYGIDACSDVFHPNSRGHLPSGELTLAEVLKAHNYSTVAVAKWHLGYALANGSQRFLPTERGFDMFHGTPSGLRPSPPGMQLGETGAKPCPLELGIFTSKPSVQDGRYPRSV